MKLFENKAVSIVLMVALIAAGTWLGGWKGLSSLYSKAEDVFFVGEDVNHFHFVGAVAYRP